MLEIIVLIILSTRIGRIAQRKGLAAWPYRLLLVGLWISFELLGFFAFGALSKGVYLTQMQQLMGMLGATWACAGIGGVIAFRIARSAKASDPDLDLLDAELA